MSQKSTKSLFIKLIRRSTNSYLLTGCAGLCPEAVSHAADGVDKHANISPRLAGAQSLKTQRGKQTGRLGWMTLIPENQPLLPN